MKKELSWKELKALNDLYTLRKSQAKIQHHPYIKYLLEEKGILDYKLGSTKMLIPADKFDSFYEANFKENFIHYKSFLEKEGLETNARKNYSEEDIKTLIFISIHKLQIVSKVTTIREFSGDFFNGKSSKYLEDKKSVRDAVLQILGISSFPEQDPKNHQWRFVVDCPEPQAVILCENLNFLKTPWKAEQNNIKLWYVGGNNIGIIDQIDEQEFNRPFFYSGDWDLAGLNIFSRIKRKLDARGKKINLLFPNDPDRRLATNVDHHNSKWDFNKELSGLNKEDFNPKEIALVADLIKNDQWIEEESNDLLRMLQNALVI